MIFTNFPRRYSGEYTHDEKKSFLLMSKLGCSGNVTLVFRMSITLSVTHKPRVGYISGVYERKTKMPQ